MKRNGQTIEEMVMQSHYLDALEIESRAQEHLSDMERKGFLDEIATLRTTIDSLRTSMEALKESFAGSTATLRLTIDDLRGRLDALTKQLAMVTGQRDSLQERLDAELRNRYGKRSCSRRYGSGKGKRDGKADRRQEREDYVSPQEEEERTNGIQEAGGGVPAGEATDAAGGETPAGSAEATGAETGSTAGGTDATGKIDGTKVKSENLSGKRGERGKYSRMNAASVIELTTSLEGAPKDMRFLGYKDVEEYTKKSYVECTVFRVAVFEDRFGERHEYYRPAEEGDSRMPYVNTVPGTHCTPEYLADLAVENRMMSIPVYRESIRHEIDRFVVSQNTDRNWLRIGARMLNPILWLLKKRLLKVKSVLNIDETWTQVRIKLKGDGTKLGTYVKKYIWVLVNKIEGITYFFYDNDEDDSRGIRPIKAFLGDFLGAIQSDGYIVYKHLVQDNPCNDHLMCWAHVHNKFQQCCDTDKNAVWFVQRIGELYTIESECIFASMTPEEIKARRNRRDVTDILGSMYKRATRLLGRKEKPYGDKMEKALRYLADNFEELKKYREDGRYTIDNMYAERAIRPFTVWRKNALFFSSEEGVETAMTYHTIIETCKNLGVNVRDYLVRAFREAMKEKPDFESIDPCLLAAKVAK